MARPPAVSISPHEHLRSFLADRNVPCPVCRYNLRGIDRAECPECGARIDLRVGSIDLKLGPWLVCVLAVAVPMGFVGVLAVIAAFGTRRIYWRDQDWIVLAGLWVVTAGCAGLLYVMSRRRSRFLRLPAARQWRRAAATVAAMAVLLAAVLWLLLRFLQT